MANEQARPFVKWAGGKSKLVPQILARIPATWNRETDLYLEPFLGGGAVFFALQPRHAVLNDANSDLIHAYCKLRDDALAVSRALHDLEMLYRARPGVVFAKIRDDFNADIATFDEVRAAQLIFLNKTCFNGIYRVNSSGGFNVPWGKNPNVGFPTLEHLQCCSSVLQDAQLLAHDFADPEIAKLDVKGALIYCDPPYMPVSDTADFTSYTADGFGYVCQLHLAVQAAYWRSEGAHVILSQSADESLVDQYRRLGFRADLVQAARAINSKGDGRGPVGEYIIY
jgi:DNA adenine methylase